LKDSSRVSEEDIDKKDLEKRVRSLTTLTKDHDIPALAADFFDSERPLPSVRAFSLHRFYSPFFSFGLREVFAFHFLCSDNEDPKKRAATAPSVEATVPNEPSFQEAAPVVKPKETPAKRVPSSCGSNRLKKATDASTSLDAHRPTTSSDNVTSSPVALLCSLPELSCSCLPFGRF
jgi:hypothetical protein